MPDGTAGAAVALTLTPAGATVAKGTWQQYTAMAAYADGRKIDVTAAATWNISDSTVVSIDASGRITGLAAGSALVSAEIPGASAAVPVTVTEAVLQSISLSPTNVAIPLLIDQPFTAIGIFSDLSQQDLTGQVTWSSADASVATVSAAGVAHPVSVGSTSIRASFGGTDASTALEVTSATLDYLDVEPTVAVLAAGFSIGFDATASFSDGSSFDVTAQALWSSDSGVAVFSGAPGVATGVSSGTATITATFGTMSESATLTVTDAVLQALTIDPSPVSMAPGYDLRLSATGSFSDGSTQNLTALVAWSSSDPAIAEVSNSSGSEGLLRAFSGGNATVTATLNGISATVPVAVTGAVLTSIDVSAPSSFLPVGFKLQFKATANFDDGSARDVTAFATWTSSNTGNANIYTGTSLAGLASGVSPGTVTISAALGGHSGATSLTVTGARLSTIVVTPDPLDLAPTMTKQFTATGQFNDGSVLDLTTQCGWRSLQKSVASVTKQGLATARHSGEATILARKGKVTGTASIHVQ